MIDPETAPPEIAASVEVGARGARERHQSRAAAVALVAPEIETFLRSSRPEVAAFRVLWDAWQVDSAAAMVWREMYYALQATLDTLAEAAA